MDSINEKSIREKLKEYAKEEVVFLKEEWRHKIVERNFEFFEKKAGANIQVVYDILDESRIINVRETNIAKRFEIKHNTTFEISVIVVFDQPKKGQLGIVTYYKHKIKRALP